MLMNSQNIRGSTPIIRSNNHSRQSRINAFWREFFSCNTEVRYVSKHKEAGIPAVL